MTIWKANPVAVAAAISALVAFVASFPQLDLDQQEVAVILGVANAVLGILTTAWTQRTALGIVVTFMQALQALFIGFRLDFLTAEQAAAAITAVTFIGAALQWWSTTPVAKPNFDLAA